MEETVSVTEFKANFLDIVGRMDARRLQQLTVTLRGAPVASITLAASADDDVPHLQVAWLSQ